MITTTTITPTYYDECTTYTKEEFKALFCNKIYPPINPISEETAKALRSFMDEVDNALTEKIAKDIIKQSARANLIKIARVVSVEPELLTNIFDDAEEGGVFGGLGIRILTSYGIPILSTMRENGITSVYDAINYLMSPDNPKGFYSAYNKLIEMDNKREENKKAVEKLSNEIKRVIYSCLWPSSPVWQDCTNLLNELEHKLTNTDMKQVTMTLETARGLYKDATPEMKKWLEENFKKEELVDDYTPKIIFEAIPSFKLTIDGLSKKSLESVANDIKLRLLMQDYCEQTGWKIGYEAYWTICRTTNGDICLDMSDDIYSPLQFKTDAHAQKFIDAYKDLLLEYFNAK